MKGHTSQPKNDEVLIQRFKKFSNMKKSFFWNPGRKIKSPLKREM